MLMSKFGLNQMFLHQKKKKKEPRFLPELIKHLPVSTKTISFTSAKFQLNIHKVFILLGLKRRKHQSYKVPVAEKVIS